MSTPYTLRLPAPPANNTQTHWGQLYGCAYSLAIQTACEQHSGPVLLITESVQSAMRLELELNFFKQNDYKILGFPDWEILPYDSFSPHQDIVSQRLLSLYELPDLKQGLLIVPATTLMQRLIPTEHVNQNVLLLNKGQTLKIQEFREHLSKGGYLHVSQVMEHGEFTVRGSIIDIFPMGSNQPYRIDLFDDEIESIRSFDPSNQRSIDNLDSIRLLPAREFPLSEEGIAYFRRQYRNRFEGNPQTNTVYKDISNGIAAAGSEFYLPLFFEKMQSLFNYLPDNTLLMLEATVPGATEGFWKAIEERHEQRRYDSERPILSPDELYLTPQEIQNRFAQFNRIIIQQPEAIEESGTKNKPTCNFGTQRPPSLLLNPHAEQPSANLQSALNAFSGRLLFVCESAGRREMMLDLLRNIQIYPHTFESWQAFVNSDEPIGISTGPVDEGLWIELAPQSTLAIVTEEQIFGQRAQQRRRRKTKAVRDAEFVISSLTDLTIGAPVVHEEHGVGRYTGLQTLEAGGNTTEFLVLEYADNDKLFVPVAALDLISRFTGTSAENAPLHKLGSEQWQRARRKAAQQVRDVAAELLDVYARRAARKGYAFKPNHQEALSFATAFPFEETPDQKSAIEAVITDMTGEQPMDRVVCGDVGFGKTEVAMRATFTALQDQKQVGILVPTTLLAQQHFQNFRDRFADWPFRIECLSRFASKKQQQTIIKDISDGKVDVVIGTHKLLQKDISFRDLGLIIVDEEHRFGVSHKERLKKLRSEVDILTLTATPIPRTLNMAMSGLRDLSIIATPPARRNAIKTFVNEWRDTIINEACQRELKRGGQVYFVHNEVKSIHKMAEQLGKLIPEARIAVAHGQLPEKELEQIMLDFYHQRYNLLLCTTIIESGIDVPTANTILINRADRFGLAQLHQLRGRVGRSHHRAYAYLITPPLNAITADAKKRLEAIESLEDLGAGFTLASHDLEIRGAGELLGEEQSGQIHEIGYTLYTEMLERAINTLKKGEEPLLDVPIRTGLEIDLGQPALLPSDYVHDVHTRLVIYKRITNAKDQTALRDLQIELIDRFGLLPEPAKNLFTTAELKLRISAIGVSKIKADLQSGYIEFTDKPNIATDHLIQLIQNEPQTFTFNGKRKLHFKKQFEKTEEQIPFIENLLSGLTGTKAA